VPEPGEEDEDTGEDVEEPSDPGESDEDTGDAPDDGDDLLTARPGGEDDEGFDDSDFDSEPEDDTGGGDAACRTATLKLGATVHKAKVARDGSGLQLVAIELVRRRR
jgi:hypothetical protein